MARKLKSDKVLFITTLLLVCASVVMVYSASAVLADKQSGQPSMFLTKQALWTVLGLAVMAVTMRVDYRTYKNDRFIWALIGAVGLMLVAVLFRPPVNSARRWISVGGLGIQPSEFAKIACIFFTALMLERRMHRINEWRYAVLPIAIVAGVLVGLIMLQPDFGTSVALLLIVGAMVFAAGLDYRVLGATALAAIPAAYIVIMSADYRRQRVMTFLDPWSDQFGYGFQIIQSFIAVGTGGVFGKGLMGGVQKLFYLPEPHTDFIFAVIGEELGLIGTTAVLLCFVVIAWRGLRISARAEDAFGSFVALGVTVMIAVQALINMSVVIGLVPNKGFPLPLMSYGGSSLLINLLAMGVLLNISQHESADA